jgi:hypothetical protein
VIPFMLSCQTKFSSYRVIPVPAAFWQMPLFFIVLSYWMVAANISVLEPIFT